MALVVKDRVRETSTTTGTGTFTLAGAVAGFQSFTAIGTGNTTYYTIVMSGDWEVGLGTWTSPNQLSRDTVLASSNAGALVPFGSGTKDVFCTFPAEGFALPPAIGGTTPNTITGTTVTAKTKVFFPSIISSGIDGTIEMVDDGTGNEYLNIYAYDGSSYYPVKFPGGLSVIGNLPIQGDGVNSGALYLFDPTTTYYGTISVPSELTTFTNFVFPATNGSANQVLQTDGTGVTSWVTPAGSGTVTSVSGTGTVSGISLSGTVTNSGSLTLGGSLDLSSPPAIGDTTPNTITGTTLTANTQMVLPPVTSGHIGTGYIQMEDSGDGTYDVLSIFAYDPFNDAPYQVRFPGGMIGTQIALLAPDYLTNYQYVNFLCPTGMSSYYNLTLPPTSGSANQVLKTDGTGVTSWTDKFILGAGTATVAPLQLTSGTDLTTAAAGAIEYNGTAAFITGTAASGRGINLAPQMVRVNTQRNKANNSTTLEAVFDAANDTLALAANTLYYFKGVYIVAKSASATASGVTVGFAFSNAQQEIGYKSIGYTAATGTAQTTIYNTVVTAVTATATATGAVDYVVEIEGWFKSNATTGGTLIPQFAQSVIGTTVQPAMKANSWFMVQPMSGTPTTTLIAGNWS